jgi:hypothetical protein
MTAQCPINTTTVNVLSQYNDAAQQLIAAYRFGSARAITGAGERYAQFVAGRSFINSDAKAKLIGAEQKVGQFVVGAVSRISDGADALVDGLARRATSGVERFDELTAWSRDSTVFNALRKLNMPVAQASLQVAEKVAQLSHKLSARVVGTPAVEAETVPAGKRTVKRAVKSAVKPSTRGATRVTTAASTRRGTRKAA